MIRNTNNEYGFFISDFENVETFRKEIIECGYDLPADGLQEGRDYWPLKSYRFTGSFCEWGFVDIENVAEEDEAWHVFSHMDFGTGWGCPEDKEVTEVQEIIGVLT